MTLKLVHLFGLVLVFVFLHPLHGINVEELGNNSTAEVNSKENVKSVSSDKVHNGGRKGPMSGNQSGLPMPFAIPFPIIPHKGKPPATNQTEVTKLGKKKEKKKNKQIKNKRIKQKVKNKNKGTSTEAVSRKKVSLVGDIKKRDTEDTEYSEKQHLTDEEEALKRSWISTSDGNNIPNTESAYFVNNDELKKAWQNIGSTNIPGDEGEELTNEQMEMMRSWLSMEEGMIPDKEGVHLTGREEEAKNKWLTGEDAISDYQAAHLTDEEEKMKQDWLSLDNEGIPGREGAHFDSELSSLLDDTANAFSIKLEEVKKLVNQNKNTDETTLIDKIKHISKRETEEDAEIDLMLVNAEEMVDRKMFPRDVSFHEDEEIAHFMGTRGVNDEQPDTVAEAELKLENANRAADQLTALELKLGIDPEHLVSNTHQHIDELQEQKAKLDSDIREHIEMSSNAESVSKKSEISLSVKQQLEKDRSKIDEINTELKQLKDIELMATGLEVAKYLAKERARHNLEVAKAAAARSGMPTKLVVQSTPPQVSSFYQRPQFYGQTGQPFQQPVYSQPIGAVPFIPSISLSSYNTRPFQDNHQKGEQRHIESRPGAQPSLTDYLSKYIQTKTAEENEFHTPSANFNFAPSSSPSSVKYFSQQQLQNPIKQQLQQQQQQQAQQQQPQQPQKLQQQSQVLLQSFPSPVSQISAYTYQPNIQSYSAGGFGGNTIRNQFQYQKYTPAVLAPEIHTNAESRDSSTQPNDLVGNDHIDVQKENKSQNNHNHDDDWGAMWFPGTTYSPPPTWLQNQNLRGVDQRFPNGVPLQQIHSIPNGWQNSLSHPPIPFVRHDYPIYASAQRPIEEHNRVQPFFASSDFKNNENRIKSPIFNTFYSPQNSQQFAQQTRLSGLNNAAYTVNQPYITTDHSMVAANFVNNKGTDLQSTLFPERLHGESRPGSGIVNSYAQQQPRISVGEVLNLSPPDETIISTTPAPSLPPPPPPPPPPPSPPIFGNVPPQWGAVNMARYAGDGLDRMRDHPTTNGSGNPVATKGSEQSSQLLKREYQKLAKANQKLQDTIKASEALTHIESAIGFDPGSIAKMVDFVKTAAIKDVELSKDTIEKDNEILKKIQRETKKSVIAKKSDIEDDTALNHAQTKLKTDEAVLLDAEDRLEKIKRMEMIVTEVEVAKFIALQNARNDVTGENERIDSIKRELISKPVQRRSLIKQKK